jgi:acid phosphatase type 7
LKVHITQGDYNGTAVIVSWFTADAPGSNTVKYEKSKNKLHLSAEGDVRKYQFYNYTSGYIHHCLLTDLEVL